LNSAVFWVVTLCSSETTRRFGGKYGLHLQGQRVNEGGRYLSPPPTRGLLFDLEAEGDVPPKLRAFSELHCVTTRMTGLIITAVKSKQSLFILLLLNCLIAQRMMPCFVFLCSVCINLRLVRGT
jgi:hypothetical protein